MAEVRESGRTEPDIDTNGAHPQRRREDFGARERREGRVRRSAGDPTLQRRREDFGARERREGRVRRSAGDPTQQVERERKFDLEPGTRLPDLSAALPVGSTLVTDTVTLISAYYDTAERGLLALGVTLRRRTGDTDTGWQLKVPVGDARTEFKLPLSAARTRVPKKLADLVKGVALGSPLVPLLTVHTVRRRQRWTTPDGVLLVELAEDDVHPTDPAGTELSAWQEVEAELGPAGSADTLDDVGAALLAAGAVAGTAANKVAKALGGAPDLTLAGKPGSALRAVLDYLAVQHGALLTGDLGLRAGVGDDIVHQTRVAVRRMRSTLRVFRKLFAAREVAALEDELKWYADLLGRVRDGDVQRERFAASIDALPPEQVLGPVRARIDEHLLGGKVAAELDLAAALDSDRYLDLLHTVAGWLSDPPLPKARKKRKRDARRARSLRKPARRAARQATDRLAAGLRRSDDVRLHRARKASKRARYAAELLALAGVDDPLASDQAVEAWKELQDLLGEHQDSVVAADLLRRLGAATADRPGENGFTYGVLHQREEHLAAGSRERAAAWTSPLR